LEAAARRCHLEELQNVVSGGQMLPVALKYGTHQQRSISSRAPHLSRRCRLLRQIGSEMGERESRDGEEEGEARRMYLRALTNNSKWSSSGAWRTSSSSPLRRQRPRSACGGIEGPLLRPSWPLRQGCSGRVGRLQRRTFVQLTMATAASLRVRLGGEEEAAVRLRLPSVTGLHLGRLLAPPP
jgi:hypothetical protein